MDILQLLLFLFGLISILMYTLIIFTLKRNRKNSLLGGSFFQIVIMQYYADLLFFIEFTIAMRFRKYFGFQVYFKPQEKSFRLFARFISGFHYYIKIVVYIGYLLFALNRLSSAFNISTYNTVNVSKWNSKIIRYVKLGRWILPCFLVLPMHALPKFEYWLDITETAIRLNNDSLSTAINAYIDGSFCLGTCIFCTCCYFATCCLIRRNWNVSRKTDNKLAVQAAVERSLLISAILSFVVLILNTIVQVTTIITSKIETQSLLFVQDLSYPLIDLMFSHFPWALLVTSSVLKKQLFLEIKLFIKKSFKLTDISITTIRVGQTFLPVLKPKPPLDDRT